MTAAIMAIRHPASKPVLNPVSVGILLPCTVILVPARIAAITAEETEVPIERITVLKLFEDAFSVGGTPFIIRVGIAPNASPVPILPIHEEIISPISECISRLAQP
jgi:hypothetical protein